MIDITKLNIGDVVYNIGSGNSYIVTAILNDKVIAVRQVEVTNPDEWELTPYKVNTQLDMIEWYDYFI